MIFDFSEITAKARYNLLTGVVVPRPIAWVTSRNANDGINLAPFSFFNVVGTDPGLVVLSVGNHPDRPKDTATNIDLRTDFVVNMVDEKSSDAMSQSAIDFPDGVSEIESLGLVTAASTKISTPRLKNAPAALECRKHSIIEIGRNRLILGEILAMYIREEFVLDSSRYHVDSSAMNLIGRMGGSGGYCRTENGFDIARLSYEAWLQKQSAGPM
jgi:flavin reductase (DIM6/NTAB) family NADH-FMN oxidoreductase RutF